MHQTAALSLTAFVSRVVGGAGGYAYTNLIHASEVADLTRQNATLQKEVDESEAAAKLKIPSDEEALAAIGVGTRTAQNRTLRANVARTRV
ncbi:MAG: hypothetical protein J0H31_16810 [Alphaproteobacteria bacterium]|nr:hypothetical protein [Alphaproteobacteria bacterium]